MDLLVYTDIQLHMADVSIGPIKSGCLMHCRVPFVYPTEIFPLASRAKGVAYATVAFSVAGGIVNEVTPYLIEAVGYWVFIIFAIINFIMLIPICLFYIGK